MLKTPLMLAIWAASHPVAVSLPYASASAPSVGDRVVVRQCSLFVCAQRQRLVALYVALKSRAEGNLARSLLVPSEGHWLVVCGGAVDKLIKVEIVCGSFFRFLLL